MDISTSVLRAPPVSSIRRKPMHTYQSPSATEKPPTMAKTLSALSQQIASASASASTSASTSTSKAAAPSTGIVIRTSVVPRKKYPMAPPLPLYHPLGRLALSLPPLEPASFGHSVSMDDSETGRRASARSRRPAAKLRDAEEDELPSRPPMPNVSAIAAVAAREIKEKASPRKRRGGAGAKRKRKETDDSEYPAKRTTRNPRGVSNIPADDGSPSDSLVPLPEVTPTPEPTGELQDDSKRPERRSTRSSGASKRRDSSASETPSASASAGARGGSKVNGTAPITNIDTHSDVEMPRNGGETKEGKEEGEVSEEAP
ncbi:hypothetical protein B0H16DRAFT_1494885 [Mycena metata]|uniref:Uncharacterized protein n=1 Tax=Mycena metata TaxID=1033252 RepID=A0AAD7P0T2_9AGAR|nr:hypothetical protein B0H16DRAFT_1494885 [Mycena metata]